MYFNPDKTAISTGTVDYMTVDFEIWADEKEDGTADFIRPLHIAFVGTKNDDDFKFVPSMVVGSAKGNDNYLTFENSAYKSEPFDCTKRTHITYVVAMNVSSDGYFPEVSVYVNGNYVVTFKNAIGNDVDLTKMRITCASSSSNKVVGTSVCVDNVTVATFGNGDGSYSGDISELFEDYSIELSECADSVLYELK